MSSSQLGAVLVALALAAATVACAAGASSAPPPPQGPPLSGQATVVLKESRFQPDALRVVTGTTVTWEWADGSVAHNVVFEGFASDTQTEGIYRQMFTEPGEFTYRCTLHPRMTGVVAVDEAVRSHPRGPTGPRWGRLRR